jgi:hypothetical protein
MTEFNPATMNPASIILQENVINKINYYDYIIIFMLIIICIFIYLKSNKNKNKN